MLPQKLCVKELFFILEVCLPFSGMDVHIFNLKMIQTNLIIVTIIILDLPLILGEHIVGSIKRAIIRNGGKGIILLIVTPIQSSLYEGGGSLSLSSS
jgi:hypothetical protein